MSKELKNKYDMLRRRYNLLVLDVEKIEPKMEKLQAEVAFCKAQLINADKNVAIQKQIVIDNIRQSQETQNNLVAEIMELKKQLKQQEV
jgi:hypothetical protein